MPGTLSGMASVLYILAVLAALGGLAAALAHGGYLALLGSAANQRAGGEPVTQYVRSRFPTAAAVLVLALIALLLSAGGAFANVLAIAAGATSGVLGYRGLQQTRARYRSGGGSSEV